MSSIASLNQSLKKYADAPFGGWVSPCFKHVKGLLGGGPILDVGCGDGTYLSQLAKASVGIDVSAPNLENCSRRSLKVARTNINAVFPFAAGTFSAVFCSHVLEHVHAPFLFLRECHRVITDDGRIIVCVPNELSVIHWFYPYFDEDGRHLYAFSPRNLEVLLGEAGFESESIYPDFVTMRTQRLHLGWMAVFLERLPMNWTRPVFYAYWIIARKK